MLLFVACGGAFGAVMRYLATNWVVAITGRGFPYGTMFVNVTGSFLLGVLSILLLEKLMLSAEWRTAVTVGVLGSFTTFSTFSLETLHLIEQGEGIAATMNILMSVVICLLAVWAGVIIGKQL